MKTLKNILIVVLFLTSLMIQSCEKLGSNEPKKNSGILPERFKVDIPSSMSNTEFGSKSYKSATSPNSDTLQGNAIYGNLNTFIAVGEASADVVMHIIGAITIYHIDQPMSISFNGEDDNRVKNLVVEENAEYSGKTWQYVLTITDAESEANADGGKALQIFWNVDPIEGIAILKPYNCDRIKNEKATDALFKIEYSEVGTQAYERYMTVEIAGLPLPDARLEPFAINSLKMFVGRNGNNVDVFGNSNHPNAKFFTDKTGFSWAFVASGLDNEDIAVAEVGLPPYTLDESDRTVLLKDYSIKNVLTEEVNQWFIDAIGIKPDSTSLSGYLKNADAPGFFTNHGFIQGGIAPSDNYLPLMDRIENLSPFNPKSVNELQIEFK
jgi:hypothetical protein